MLNSLYDILGLFEDAFERAGSVAGLIQVDASGETRYAEGTTKEGTPWHIESDFSNSTLQDSDQLRLGYAQLGDLLLVPFYESAKAKFNNSGWTVTHIETHVQKVMEPVLNAMRFNMGLAATRGWLQDQFSYDPLGNTREKAPFTLDQVVSWTQLGIPGRWSSMELMSMLIDLEQGGHYLDYVSGKKWIASHQKKMSKCR